MIAKTAEEIAILRDGGRRLGTVVKRLADMVKPGVTGTELEDAAREMVESGGDELAFLHYPSGRQGQLFPGGLCLSINDVIVHSPAATFGAVIEEGDVVSLDFGIKHRGLFTDHAVTVIAGEKHDPADVKMLSAAYEALQLGIDQARVGNRTGDIGAAIQRIADLYGYGYPLNLSGHGVGKAVHEEPHVPNYGEPGKGEKLTEGLVIAIEPMFIRGRSDLYIDKDGFTYRTKDASRTVHVEHTVLITKDGPEILTKV